MRHILLIEDHFLANATRRFLSCTHGFESHPIPPAVLVPLQQENKFSVLDHFDVISNWLEIQVDDSNRNRGIPRVLVHTDFLGTSELSSLNPVRQVGDDKQSKLCVLLSMLILAFPEVHWVFVCQRPRGEDFENSLLNSAHFYDPENSEWLELAHAGFNNLFDVTGLRDRVHANLKKVDPDLQYLSSRAKTGAAIDDEQDYAIFHAYIGYRYGFRSCAVASARLMERLFAKGGLLKPDLVLEDLFLGFSDRGETLRPKLFLENSYLDKRDVHFPNLASSSYRRCITSGHTQGQSAHEKEDGDREKSNIRYYSNLRSTGPGSPSTHILLKPCSGVFDLWKRSRLSDQVGKVYPWPIVDKRSQPSNHHSVRERLPSIINRMVNRAEAIIRDEPSSVPACIYGAVLANEAYELLDGRAWTTALRATSLKHECEVIAECIFFGATYHLDAKSRIEDIQNSIENVKEWFSKKNNSASLLNIRAGIINRLLIRYRNNVQFDEEQTCLQEIRRAHSGIKSAERGLFRRWVLALPSRYTLFLFSSVERFLLMIVTWVVVLWGAFALLAWDWKWSPVPDWKKVGCVAGDSLQNCVNSFLGFSVNQGWQGNSICPPAFLILSCIAVIWGIFHLGIFVAHVYSYLARK